MKRSDDEVHISTHCKALDLNLDDIFRASTQFINVKYLSVEKILLYVMYIVYDS